VHQIKPTARVEYRTDRICFVFWTRQAQARYARRYMSQHIPGAAGVRPRLEAEDDVQVRTRPAPAAGHGRQVHPEARRHRRGLVPSSQGRARISKTRDAFRQLVDSHYFSGSLHFDFNEKHITKSTALDVLDVVRNRKGLMDHVDLSGLTYVE